MTTEAWDFRAMSTQDPLSDGGNFTQGTAGAAVELVVNAGDSSNVNARGDVYTTYGALTFVSTSHQTHTADQYSEITLTTKTSSDSVNPACFCGLTDAYFVLLFINGDSGSNKVRKLVSGTASDVTSGSLAGYTVAANDVWGLRATYSGGTTTLKVYQNPTTYDGDGFPTDGLTITCTDTDLSSGQCGIESYNGNSRGAYASDFYTAWAAASSGTYRSADPRKRGRIVHVT